MSKPPQDPRPVSAEIARAARWTRAASALVTEVTAAEEELLRNDSSTRAALEGFALEQWAADPSLRGLCIFVRDAAGTVQGFAELVIEDAGGGAVLTWDGPHRAQ